MKRYIWAICLLFISLTASADINFLDNPVWSSVLAQAKKENKMIFLDGYATWCGPCKQMDSETYKNQAVSAYYNANFINVKYDLEKGEGKTLAEKYAVTAYPFLMFIDAQGVILHKGVGFSEAADFVNLGKEAKDPNSQYFTLKKNALELSTANFVTFAAMASQFEDEDFDETANTYLMKQADILGDENLIRLVMQFVNTLPDEKSLAYFKANEAKITKSKVYNKVEFEERLISLAIGQALADEVQTNQESLDFEAMAKVLDKYIPEKSFFVLNYFKAQHALDNANDDEALTALYVLLENTPSKVTYDQLCNVLMNMVPEFAKKGKDAEILKKFDAVKIPEKEKNKAYMKDFVKAIIYIKTGDMDKFKQKANEMIASKEVPEEIKLEIKTALDRVNEKDNAVKQ